MLTLQYLHILNGKAELQASQSLRGNGGVHSYKAISPLKYNNRIDAWSTCLPREKRCRGGSWKERSINKNNIYIMVQYQDFWATFNLWAYVWGEFLKHKWCSTGLSGCYAIFTEWGLQSRASFPPPPKKKERKENSSAVLYAEKVNLISIVSRFASSWEALRSFEWCSSCAFDIVLLTGQRILSIQCLFCIWHAHTRAHGKNYTT